MSAGVLGDLFALPASWKRFACHEESLTLDFSTKSGEVVSIRGQAEVYPDTRRVFVSVSDTVDGVSRFDAAAALTAAILDRLIGSDTLRAAVELEWHVASIGAVREVH